MRWPWQKKEPPRKAVVCMMHPAATQELAQQLRQWGEVEPIPIEDDYDVIRRVCLETGAELLIIEAGKDENGYFDTDVSTRCDWAAVIRKKKPDFPVYLLLDPALEQKRLAAQKAVELDLINGYAALPLTHKTLKAWLAEAGKAKQAAAKEVNPA